MLTINELRQFSGTEHWYKHLSGYLYTDGVQYVAQNGGAYWLVDKILFTTRAKNNLQEFGVWKLEVNEDKSAILICEDYVVHNIILVMWRRQLCGASSLEHESFRREAKREHHISNRIITFLDTLSGLHLCASALPVWSQLRKEPKPLLSSQDPFQHRCWLC